MSSKYHYSMWNSDFFSLKYANTTIKPFVFKDKNGTRDSFKIEELDLITSKYESRDSFYNALEKFGDRYLDGKNKDIIITHTHNGNLYYDEVIYNDKLVEKVVTQVMNNKDIKKDNLPIPNSRGLSFFISYIEDIATSNQYEYLLYPERINDISPNDANILSSCIKKDILSDDGKVAKKGIHSLLCEYRDAYSKNRACLDVGAQNDYERAELDRVREKINRHVRSSYKVFRDLVAWQVRYYKVLTKRFIEEKDPAGKLKIYRLMADVSMEKELHEGKIDNNDMYDYYTMYRKMININNDGKISIDNIDDEKINGSMKKQVDKINGFGRK